MATKNKQDDLDFPIRIVSILVKKYGPEETKKLLRLTPERREHIIGHHKYWRAKIKSGNLFPAPSSPVTRKRS